MIAALDDWNPTPEEYEAFGRWIDEKLRDVPCWPERVDPSQLQPYFDAGLGEHLIPLHRWDHRDARGLERGKSPRDNDWHQRIYSKEELAANSAADGNTGNRIAHGWIVFDYDSRNVPPGRDVIAEFQSKYGIDLTKYPRVRTGSGDFHAYGRAPGIGGGVSNGLPGFDGIEFKALGRQVVCPGSVHPNGWPYKWIDGPQLKDAPEWPAELIAALTKAMFGHDEASSRSDTKTGERGDAPPRTGASAHEPEPIDRVRACLDQLPTEDFGKGKYHEWIEIGMAVHQASRASREGLDLWIEWSARDAKYEKTAARECKKHWITFHLDRPGGVGMGTLVDWVQKRGGRVPPPPRAPAEEVFDSVASAEQPGVPAVVARPFLTRKDDGEGPPHATFRNALAAVRALPFEPSFDEFEDRVYLRSTLPWDHPVKDRGWGEPLMRILREFLIEQWQLELSLDAVNEAVQTVALERRFNPVVEWLDSLTWDGTPRIDMWLTTYAGAEDTPYTRAVGRIMLLGAVARACVPGIKFDVMLVFEGAQGIGKSSLLKKLAREEWVLEGLPTGDLNGKETAERLIAKWICEVPELNSVKRADDVAALKEFLSKQVDRFRPSYGRIAKDYLRRCIFVGTTNESSYLRDSTGNRRYLPVRLGEIKLDAVARDRDVLWAEARDAWKADPRAGALVLPHDLWPVAAAEQEARRSEHPWEERIEKHVAGVTSDTIATSDLLYAIGIPADQQKQRHVELVAEIMRQLGWEPHRWRVGSARVRGWRRPK